MYQQPNPTNPMARDYRSINANENRFKILNNPVMRQAYYDAAFTVGLTIGPGLELSPLVLTQQTPITTTDPLHPGDPVALSATTPNAVLRYYFQDGAFVKRITYTVTAPRLLADGTPEAGFFEGTVDPGDYVYGQWKRAGAGQVFMDFPCPLSEIGGPGSNPYFFDLIPCVQPAGTLLLDLSIVPNAHVDSQTPPFVDRLGMVQVSLHCERINNFGV